MQLKIVLCTLIFLLDLSPSSCRDNDEIHQPNTKSSNITTAKENIITEVNGETLKSIRTQPIFDHTDLKRWDSYSEKMLINRQMTGAAGSHCQYSDFEKTFRLTTPEILRRDGYDNVESHYVTTADGYIVEIHRIPKPGRPVIYALAGIFQSSRDLVINCKERSLAEKLSEGGYDVWLGNFRGNRYGRNHTTLSTATREFWSFKTDDIIEYDAPAIVDYILGVSGEKNLTWIGFSLGNTILFGLLASHPEYNTKIQLGVALGPAVYFGNTRSLTLNVMARNRRLMMDKDAHIFQVSLFGLCMCAFVNNFWKGEVLPPLLTYLINIFGPKLCIPDAQTDMQLICSRLLNFVDGKDTGQINYAVLPLLLGGFPSPTSVSTVGQWFQWIENNRFNRFDYGTRTKNFLMYGEESPPEYNLENVRAPILTIVGDNDFLTVTKDTMRLNEALPNLVGSITVNWKMFNHMDFLYARDADILVYDYILNVLKMSFTDAVKHPN